MNLKVSKICFSAFLAVVLVLVVFQAVEGFAPAKIRILHTAAALILMAQVWSC